MLLIRQAAVYAPEYLGIKDVLICSNKIEAIEDHIDGEIPFCKVVDGHGKKLTPGFLDPHIHITGGGGEGSFHTQVPAVKLSELLEGGVTTVVGLLGTDGLTRSVENLIAQAKSLKEQGLTVYALTGSYGYPSTTITGDVRKDILFVDEIIGAKLAISDHRAPNVTVDELIRLASDTRVAGMLSGKCGMVTLHMGGDNRALDLVMEALDKTSIPIKIFHPTHVTRAERLLEQAYQFANRGGYIDMTCGSKGKTAPTNCIMQAKEKGVAMDRITLSSDGMGSWSTYDAQGNLLKIGYSRVDTVYEEIKKLVQQYGMPLEEALCFGTSNTAHALELYPRKGHIQVGADADLLLMEENLDLNCVIANGRLMMEDGKLLVKGTYEQGSIER